ncbi:aminotransferase class I/II-fold pyridoxal phosphate-dependent enzyme [Antrihabitans stalactiti]|uniref:PLP-dependent aminotransferase family protein n=1 Tax=Antrihabitans stalactiti TaxID=2584121 RepID=A0A848KFM7_9NOCA|nr:PLP-dependent aminotransferase family protein [Antrihabitans stalactiti]
MDVEHDLPIVVDRESATPLAVQVADALRSSATNGHLLGGDRLPSSRALALRLGVSRTVTSAAYDQLLAEGWIVGRHGSGTYLTATPHPAPPKPTLAVPRDDDATLIDLAPGSPCVECIDDAAWRRAWRAAADGPQQVRPERAGLPDYRAAVAEHLLRHRGLVGNAAAGVVLATAGTSSATGELAGSLWQRGDAVAVEEPGYNRAVGSLLAAGMTIVPVPVDADGLCLDALPSGIRAVYCTPAHQFPLGARMPAMRRVELVERARREGFLVIEDDYDGELRYDTAPLPLLASIGPDVVVHLGTTSKILTPALGVGWMSAPDFVAAAVLERRERIGVGPSPAGQRVLIELARSGDLARHLRRVRREAAERRTLVVDTFRSAGIEVVGDDAGAHIVVALPSAEAEIKVVDAGRRSGLHLDGLERHHSGPARTFGIAIGYTAASGADLRRALPLIVEAVAGVVMIQI